MAENTPAWLNFLEGGRSRSRRDDTPAWLKFLEGAGSSSRASEPLRLMTPDIVLSPEQQRLEDNANLKKQVDRLQRAQQSGEILGVDTTPPRGLLGWFTDTAKEAALGTAEAGFNIVKPLFQAMSVIGAGSKQVLNALDTAVESDYNPLNWLADRMDEYTYGRVRTKEEREQSIERKLEKIPGAEAAGKFGTEQLGLRVGEYGPISFQEFKQDVAGIRGGGEIIPELVLTEDAGMLEKLWKLPAAFAYDLRSAGGPRGFIRTGSNALGRKVAGRSYGDFAKDAFLANAKRLPDETDVAFQNRAMNFAVDSVAGNLRNRSRGLVDAYRQEFGTELGEKLFKELPKEFKGGFGVSIGGVHLGNLNAGGMVVDRVARTLGLDPKVFGSKWNPLHGYQTLKNNARSRSLGRILNAFGAESRQWGNFVGMVAKNAGPDDLRKAYDQFYNKAAYNPGARMNEIMQEITLPVHNFNADMLFMRENIPDAYKRFEELVDDPNKLASDQLDEFDEFAVNNVQRYREQFDNMHQQGIDLGIPMNYLNNFFPVIFDTAKMDKDNVTFDLMFPDNVVEKLGFRIGAKQEVTTPGLVNLPAKGYDPTKDRNIFMVEIKNEAGDVIGQRSASPAEMRQLLRDAGVDEKYIKYLKTDPLIMLSDYSARMARFLAEHKLAKELYEKGLLMRGDVPVLNPTVVRNLVQSLRPDQTARVAQDFLRDRERFDTYIQDVNQRVGELYLSTDPAKIKEANDIIASTMDAFTRLGDIILEDAMTPTMKARHRKLMELYDEQIDRGELSDAAKTKAKLDKLRADAQKIEVREDAPEPVLERNIQKQAYKEYLQGVTQARTTNLEELMRRHNLSKLGPLTGSDIGDTARIPDVLAGTVATAELRRAMGAWIRWNSATAMDEDTLRNAVDAINSATQLFRTGATFGRGPGFVSRNFIGATQQNIIGGEAKAAMFDSMRELQWMRIAVDTALSPLSKLQGDRALSYVDKLSKNGKMADDMVEIARGEIRQYSKVTDDTLARLRKQIMIDKGREIQVPDTNVTLADVYETMIKEGVYDPHQSVAMYSGLKPETNLAHVLNNDPRWLRSRHDRVPIQGEFALIDLPLGKPGTQRRLKVKMRKPTFLVPRAADDDRSTLELFGEALANSVRRNPNDPRAVPQRVGEALNNFGFDIQIGTRIIPLRPVQLVAKGNQIAEEYQRGVSITSGLHKFGTDEKGQKAAGEFMRALQFDYSNLTEGERLFGRLGFPFWTWMRYNLPLQMRLLVQQPGTFNTVLQGWDTVKGIIGDPNGDQYFIPEYAREAYAFAINPELQDKLDPLMQVLGAEEDNPMLLRLESPILDINRYFSEDVKKGPLSAVDYSEFVGSMNPFIKAVIQAAAGRNIYTGRVYDEEGVSAPPWYLAISEVVGKYVPGVTPTPDPETGELKVNERWLDFFKTTVPGFTTADRTTMPALEASLEVLGYDVDLSAEDEKALTSILSMMTGAPVSTLTPTTEAGEVAARYRYAETEIMRAARQKRINEQAVAEFVRNAEKAGMAEPEIIRRGASLADSGYFSF